MGVASMGVLRPDLVMKSIIPVIMAGVIGIYGLIVAVIINSSIGQMSADGGNYCTKAGFAHFGAGLAVCALLLLLLAAAAAEACIHSGLSGLAAGIAIGIVGDAGVRAYAQQPKLFVGIILILIFAEGLGLYGLLVDIVVQGATCEKPAA